MSLKPGVEALPPILRQKVVDLAGTNHDDHVCCESEVECPVFDEMVDAIQASHPLLTEREKEVLELLGQAWSAFLKMERAHRSDTEDFMRHIHDAQRVVAAQVSFRTDPDFMRVSGK